MTRDEYDQRKRRLDEQLREGIALLESAHRQQHRALELVWMTTAEEGFPLPPTPPVPPKPAAVEPPAAIRSAAPPQRPRRLKAGQLEEDVYNALDAVADEFNRHDVLKALRYQPDRGSLYRVLSDFVRAGILAVEQIGTGKVPTVYRKIHEDDGAAPMPDE